jgi:NAD(P)-dependent dehydrogenase (short-subunit alcohol dehydrogenase family)
MVQIKHAELLSLEGRVMVVSGASSGIGEGCARFLGEMGAMVALLDVNEEGGRQAAAAIGGGAVFVTCDVTREGDCKNAVKTVRDRWGRIDGLVNCAGVIRRDTTIGLSEEDWDISVDVSMKGVFLLSKAVLPVMEAQASGSIVNIGSGWGIRGGPKAVSYCAAKGGVVNMTRAMAIDHGPSNIRVNCVCPGDVDTPHAQGRRPPAGREHGGLAGRERHQAHAESRPPPRHRNGGLLPPE